MSTEELLKNHSYKFHQPTPDITYKYDEELATKANELISLEILRKSLRMDRVEIDMTEHLSRKQGEGTPKQIPYGRNMDKIWDDEKDVKNKLNKLRKDPIFENWD